MFLNICVLYLLYFGNVVLAMSKVSKYDRIEALDGQTCPGNYVVFHEKNMVSVAECLKLCSSSAACAGVSYQQSKQQCIGCDWQFQITTVGDVFEGSKFFQLNYCPDSTGRIQPEVDFRLQIYTYTKNQLDATDICESELNGHLVVLDEEWKMTRVSNVLNSCSGYYDFNDYWTDGSCVNGKFQFRDGTEMPMTQTTFWIEGKPDNFDVNCVRVTKPDQIFRWDDRNCVTNYRFICQFEYTRNNIVLFI